MISPFICTRRACLLTQTSNIFRWPDQGYKLDRDTFNLSPEEASASPMLLIAFSLPNVKIPPMLEIFFLNPYDLEIQFFVQAIKMFWDDLTHVICLKLYIISF